jgi:hypothetical protein
MGYKAVHWPATFLIILLTVSAFARGQTTSAPTTASTEPTRKTVALPEKFKLVSITGRSVLCNEKDVRWIQQALLTLEPATRPSTMPSDLLIRLGEKRDDLIKQVTADLALNDPGAATRLVDDKLAVLVKKFRDMRVPLYFLATTVDKLDQLVKGGWGGDWFFHDNNGQLMLKAGVTLDPDKPIDDVVLPVLFGPDDTPEQKVATLARVVRSSENNIQTQLAFRSALLVQLAIGDFINDEVIVPLKLENDQQWLRYGVCGVLSAKYLCQISGIAMQQMIDRMTAESPKAPVRAATVDLVHPTNFADLREELVPYYVDATRRKSTKVVYEWTKGDGAPIARSLVALRKTPAPDAAALVQRIKEATGTDLTEQLGPRFN